MSIGKHYAESREHRRARYERLVLMPKAAQEFIETTRREDPKGWARRERIAREARRAAAWQA